jgi:hypothetical protein
MEPLKLTPALRLVVRGLRAGGLLRRLATLVISETQM